MVNKMMRKCAILPAVIALAALAGCKEANKDDTRQQGMITVSSVPLLQQALVNEVPAPGGQLNEAVMSSICQYVAGQIDKAHLDASLAEQSLNASAFGTNDGKQPPDYALKCAAYISAKIFKTDIFLASEHLQANDEQAVEQIAQRLQQLTPSAVHVAQYLAQLAASSEGMTFATVADYQTFIHQQLSETAPAFVKSVMNDPAQPESYRDRGVNAGYRFRISDNTIVMSLYDADWLGNGKAMGTEYKVSIQRKK